MQCYRKSRRDTEIDKKNKPRARSDYYYNVIRPARSSGGGGGKESHNRLRPPGNVIENNSNSSFQNDNLHTFSRGGNITRVQHQHGSRSDIFPRNSNTQKSPPIKYNNFKSNYTPETAENKQLYQSIIKCKTIKDTVAVAHDHLDKL